LGFQTIPGGEGSSPEVGVPLPVPPVREAAEMIAKRSAEILRRYQAPFLLENPAYYVTDLLADPEIGDDLGLLDAIMQRSNCHLLLDLHNVHCNAVNLGDDPFALLDRATLDRVVEIHVAGGSWHNGFWMDGHTGQCRPRCGICLPTPYRGLRRKGVWCLKCSMSLCRVWG
jgi:uncharacterized protein (UPF0276 family)